MKQQLAKVEQIVESYDCEPSNLIAIMQEIQTEFNYLSEAALEKIAEMLEIPISRVYSVATFYENFSLEAKGELKDMNSNPECSPDEKSKKGGLPLPYGSYS